MSLFAVLEAALREPPAPPHAHRRYLSYPWLSALDLAHSTVRVLINYDWPSGWWAMIAFICLHPLPNYCLAGTPHQTATNRRLIRNHCAGEKAPRCVYVFSCVMGAHTSHVKMTKCWKHTTCIVWRLYTLTTWKLKLYIPLRGAMKLLLSSSKFLPTFTRT